MVDQKTLSTQTNINNLADARWNDTAYVRKMKDLIAGILFSKPYEDLPTEWQFIGDQLTKILLNSVGDKLGVENRGKGLAAIHQGILAAGGLHMMTSDRSDMGVAYGHGAATVAMASQLEDIVNNIYNNKDGKINTDVVGTIPYSMLTEATAQIARERGFKEGDIITHQFEKGSEGILKGIRELKSKGIDKDNYDLREMYIAHAVTKQYEDIGKEYEEKFNANQVTLSNGTELKVDKATEKIEKLQKKLQDKNLSDENRAAMQGELAELTAAVAPYMYRSTINALKNKKNRTDEETRQLREAEKWDAQHKYDYAYDRLIHKQIEVTDENGKVLEDNHLIEEGDLRVMQQSGKLTGAYVTNNFQSALKDSLKAAIGNLEILKQAFDTDDFHKLQEISKELGMGSLTKKENVENVRNNLNRAVALANTSGRELKEVLIEQGDIRENLSKVLGVDKEYINSNTVAHVQQLYAQHSENYNKGYTKINPAQAQAIFLEQQGNAFNVLKHEALANAIANNEEYSYITAASPEAATHLKKVLALYEKANNASSYREAAPIRSMADAEMMSFRKKYLTPFTDENILAISNDEYTKNQDYIKNKSNNDVAWNARDALLRMDENSSLANTVRNANVDESYKQNWKEIFVTTVRNVNSLFGTNRDALNEFLEKTQTKEGTDAYIKGLKTSLKDTGYKSKQIEQYVAQATELASNPLLRNQLYRDYAQSILDNNRNVNTGVVNDIKEKTAQAQATLSQLSNGSTVTMNIQEQIRDAIVGGQALSIGAAVLDMLESGKDYEGTKFVTLDENGNIVLNGDEINKETEKAKGLAYINLNDLESIRNNKKLRTALGLNDVADDEINRTTVISALARFRDNGGSIININGNEALLADETVQENAREQADKKIEEQREIFRERKKQSRDVIDNSYVRFFEYLPLVVNAINNGAESVTPNANGVPEASPLSNAVKNFGGFKEALTAKDNNVIDKFFEKYGAENTAIKDDVKKQWLAAVNIIEKYDKLDKIGENETNSRTLAQTQARLKEILATRDVDASEIKQLVSTSDGTQADNLMQLFKQFADENDKNLIIKGIDTIRNILPTGKKENTKEAKDNVPTAYTHSADAASYDNTNNYSSFAEANNYLAVLPEINSSLLRGDQVTLTASTTAASSINDTLGSKIDYVGTRIEATTRELRSLNSLFNTVITGTSLNAHITNATA